ncbi:hypothetical protein EDB80DRAFT_839410 [Ilyonectria destructans]|nr:hypothetical protein EDB80DRAFT_839410 [Ilyonectria destructans]
MVAPPPDKAIDGGKLSRTSHQKSRAGCKICKQRRIKCDETQPKCLNCIAFGVECSYTQLPPSVTQVKPTLFINNAPGMKKRRGRPRRNWPENNASANKEASTPAPRLELMSNSFRSYASRNIIDFHLLKHYITGASDFSATGSREESIARVRVRQLGFSHPFVLDFVHCLSALHLARLQPHRRRCYHDLAGQYSSSGLKSLAGVLHRVDIDNCHAIFAAAVFVCFNALAQGPMPGEYLLFNESSPAIWFQLVKGVKSIIRKFGSSHIFSGPLESLSTGECGVVAKGLLQLDWLVHFQELREAIASSDDLNKLLNLETLSSLWLCFEATWDSASGAYRADTNAKLAFIWVYHLNDDFVLQLQEKKPFPLLIFAYFAVLMRTLGSVWFISGWPQHIIVGIRSLIREEYSYLMQWPLDVAGRSEISDSDGSLAPLPILEASIEKMSQANEMSGTDDGLGSVAITDMQVGDSDRADMICNFNGREYPCTYSPVPQLRAINTQMDRDVASRTDLFIFLAVVNLLT